MNKKRYLGILFGLLVINQAEALVYRCISSDGAVSYQDIGCAHPHPENRSLPITLNPRLKNRSHPHSGVTTRMKKKEPSTLKTAQQQQKALRQAQIAKAKAKKQAAWRAKLCEHAQSQKADILNTLRHGYRATAKHHLNERLKKIEERERRYCQTTRQH